MTASANDQGPAGPSKDEAREVYSSPDWYLQDLIDMVNGTNTELPLTLFVKGTVVSGMLVSGHKYFEGMKESFSRYFDAEDESTSGAIANLTEPGKNYLKSRDEANYPFPYFAHLQNAKVFSPGNNPMPGNGMWWRCRLSEVDAFSFGALGPSPSQT